MSAKSIAIRSSRYQRGGDCHSTRPLPNEIGIFPMYSKIWCAKCVNVTLLIQPGHAEEGRNASSCRLAQLCNCFVQSITMFSRRYRRHSFLTFSFFSHFLHLDPYMDGNIHIDLLTQENTPLRTIHSLLPRLSST